MLTPKQKQIVDAAYNALGAAWLTVPHTALILYDTRPANLRNAPVSFRKSFYRYLRHPKANQYWLPKQFPIGV